MKRHDLENEIGKLLEALEERGPGLEITSSEFNHDLVRDSWELHLTARTSSGIRVALVAEGGTSKTNSFSS